jgi:hypothetical protein
MRARVGWRAGLVIALALCSLLPGGGAGPAAAQGVPVGTAQNAVGTLVVVRTGGIWAKAGSGANQLEIESPAAVVAARDAEIDVKVAEDGQSSLTVVQGTAELGTPFGVCAVRGGTASVGARGAVCTAPQPANVAAAVSWKQAVSQ